MREGEPAILRAGYIPQNPASADVFIGKFKKLAGSVLTALQADQLIGAGDSLGSLPMVKPIVDLLVKNKISMP